MKRGVDQSPALVGYAQPRTMPTTRALLAAALGLITAAGCATTAPLPRPSEVGATSAPVAPGAQRFYGVYVTDAGVFVTLDRMDEPLAGSWTHASHNDEVFLAVYERDYRTASTPQRFTLLDEHGDACAARTLRGVVLQRRSGDETLDEHYGTPATTAVEVDADGCEDAVVAIAGGARAFAEPVPIDGEFGHPLEGVGEHTGSRATLVYGASEDMICPGLPAVLSFELAPAAGPAGPSVPLTLNDYPYQAFLIHEGGSHYAYLHYMYYVEIVDLATAAIVGGFRCVADIDVAETCI
jgi:hypothetical protein